MLRNSKMYHFKGSYIYRQHHRDSIGEATGSMYDALGEFEVKVVAPNEPLARAWVEERHNAGYLNHKDFQYELLGVEDAPHIINVAAY